MKTWKAIVTLIAVILLFIALGLYMSQDKLELKGTQEYQVQSGETLWEICSEYRPATMSIQEYIYNVKEHNNIGSIIYPGQVIEILIYEEA